LFQNKIQLIYNTAMEDGSWVPIFMEQEPGSSGVNTIDYYARKLLVGFSFKGHKTTGSKEFQANPVSAAAEKANTGAKTIYSSITKIKTVNENIHNESLSSIPLFVAYIFAITGLIGIVANGVTLKKL
jgi:hypothetical protein